MPTNMRNVLSAAVVVALSAGAIAQDKITLRNGDVLTGAIKTMADGKVTITSPVLGDVTVPMADISDMVTKEQVDLETKSGDRLKRRIVGMEAGSMRLEGDTTSLALDNLGMINPPAKAEPKWEGSLKLGGFWAEGNSDRRSANAAFDASMRRTNDRVSFDASWNYSEDKDGEEFQSDGVTPNPDYREWKLSQRRAGAGLKYDYFLSKRWYLLVNSRVLGDTLADLELRFTGGAGLGYTWIEDKETTFLTELGLSYINENYRSNTPSTDSVAVRVAYKLTHQLSEATRLTHGVEAFPSTETIKDTYLLGRTEIVTSLTESMIASIGHEIDYDNTPAPGADRVDNRVILAVGWSF